MNCFRRLWTWLPFPQSTLSTRTGGGKCRLENVTSGKILIICEGLRQVAYFRVSTLMLFFCGLISLGRNENCVFDLGVKTFKH